MYDMIVIGAGTAGLSAAIYGIRAGKNVLVLEKSNYGGQIIKSQMIENYPGIEDISGYDFATDLYDQARNLGLQVVYEEVTGIEKGERCHTVYTKINVYQTCSIIIATGAKPRLLGISREEEFTGKGVSYCASCDGPFFKNRNVAVVGGGNTAIQDAIILSEYCKIVYIIHWLEEFQAEKKLQYELKEIENIRVLYHASVKTLIGSQLLTGIEVSRANESHPIMIDISGLFIAIGHLPDNHIFADVVELDELGYIIAGEDCKTSAEGIFVAGDTRTKQIRQLTTAASDGTIAALMANRYCENRFSK